MDINHVVNKLLKQIIVDLTSMTANLNERKNAKSSLVLVKFNNIFTCLPFFRSSSSSAEKLTKIFVQQRAGFTKVKEIMFAQPFALSS